MLKHLAAAAVLATIGFFVLPGETQAATSESGIRNAQASDISAVRRHVRRYYRPRAQFYFYYGPRPYYYQPWPYYYAPRYAYPPYYYRPYYYRPAPLFPFGPWW